MIKIIKSKLRYKIMFLLFLLMTFNSVITMYITSNNIKNNDILLTKKYLSMLNESIFQTLRNSMNTGDTTQIQKAEKEARQIPGVKNLIVAKSLPLIQMYSPNESYTQDKDILNVFESKKTSIIEYKQNDHNVRMIKPMVATNDCLMCHANQKEGDIIGVIDLTFSLEEADEQLLKTTFSVLSVSSILGWITLIVIFIFLKKSTKPIETLETAIKELTNNSTTNGKRLNIQTNDEIGNVSRYFNKYIQKIEDNLKKDNEVINEAKIVIEHVKNGEYSKTIQLSTENRSLEEFKQCVNEMIEATQNHLLSINSTLQEYAKHNYIKELNLQGINKDSLFEKLILNINILRASITDLLIENKSNGLNLNQSSDILLKNVDILNQNSNEAAAALEQTAATLEQITANISNNTNNVIEMANLASNVTDSAFKGETLANNTAIAMNNIDEKVNAINESIKIIEQIAFQTNILSLNAAVEAATAGEAGKGFAVVAGEVRNLASRSAEAANDIKGLVEEATLKADNGKKTADEMIKGYNTLNENISRTIELIKNVESASKEQLSGIEQINLAVNSLDSQTQQNAMIASQTHDVAIKTDTIAKLVVEDANNKEFIGKNIEKRKELLDLEYQGKEKRKREKLLKDVMKND